jgi:hydroxyethylthiazole kinase-like uncharacterized protein yjeF
MKYIVDSTEMKNIDNFTIDEIGIPSMVLMERAALQVVQVVTSHVTCKDRIVVVCGSGNNGADGVAIARLLFLKGYEVGIKLLTNEDLCKGDLKNQIKIARNLGINIDNKVLLNEYTIVIDAIFGIGLNRQVSGIHSDFINLINQGNYMVFSVDIPSGLSADTGKPMNISIKANYTITFGYEKIGLLLYPGTMYAGEIITADIGFPDISCMKVNPRYISYDEKDLNLIPKRTNYSNKGTYGKVLIIAGNINMAGASYLSAKAAYNMGTGLVKVMTPKENRIILQTLLPEAVLVTYDNEQWNDIVIEKLKKELTSANVVVFGPGLGMGLFAERMFEFVIANCKVPLIIDADGINILAKRYNDDNGVIDIENVDSILERVKMITSVLPNNTILTPHLKELSRLLNISVHDITSNITQVAELCTNDNNIIFTLKDARTIVVGNEKRHINCSGNNGMATAGSGDVLTGIIAGLIAQGLEPLTSAMLGVYIHGLAGDIGSENKGNYSLMASDIIEALPHVLK